MNEVRMLVLVVVLSVLIFMFISLVLGQEEDNALSGDAAPSSKSCGPGTAYSEHTGGCKALVNSNKRLSDRLTLLIPYFAAHQERAGLELTSAIE